MPAKYIYEPWSAPRTVQEQAGCVVGVDYPAPIVDHKVVSKRNMMWMKEAYARHRLKNGGNAQKGKKAKTSAKSNKRKKSGGGRGGKKQTTLMMSKSAK